MIERRNGDVLSIEKGIIVHGCNCLGVMGSGIAATIKSRYPKAFEAYKNQEKTEGLFLGGITYVEVEHNKFIVNALTQKFYYPHQSSYGEGRYTSYDAIQTVFLKVSQLVDQLNKLRSDDAPFDVYFPLIGAVRGGGKWDIIEKIIDLTIPDEVAKKILYIYP